MMCSQTTVWFQVVLLWSSIFSVVSYICCLSKSFFKETKHCFIVAFVLPGITGTFKFFVFCFCLFYLTRKITFVVIVESIYELFITMYLKEFMKHSASNSILLVQKMHLYSTISSYIFHWTTKLIYFIVIRINKPLISFCDYHLFGHGYILTCTKMLLFLKKKKKQT